MANIFPQIHGNRAAKERLAGAIRAGTLPHALILAGPTGSGRRLLARELAAALVCMAKDGASLPCGACEACRKVREGIFPDLHTVSPEDGKQTIGVAAIREIRAELSLSASESPYRVFIIEAADAMNTAAQNALLVALEEPPEGVVFLLIAESEDALLPTIRSRCQIVHTEIFPDEVLCRYLGEDERFAALRAKDPARADILIKSSGGCLGRAIALLDGTAMAAVLASRTTVDAVITALGERGSAELFGAFRLLPNTKREELGDLLALLGDALRDLILVKRAPSAPLLYYADREAALTASERIGIRRLFALSDAISEAREDLGRNANVSVLLSSLLSVATAR